jgi:hypothetical protein
MERVRESTRVDHSSIWYMPHVTDPKRGLASSRARSDWLYEIWRMEYGL